MPIDYEHLMSLRARSERVQYTDRDVLLYALGVGLGREPSNRGEQPYLGNNAGLRTLPTFPSILVGNRLLGDCGWNVAQVVPREEVVTLDRPLEDSGTLLVDSDVVAVFDKGAEAGALITVESRARRERDGQPQFAVRRTWLARGDGGFGGPQGGFRGSGTVADLLPQRRPDMTHACETRADQALLFRLSVERSGLGAEPATRWQGANWLVNGGPVLDILCLQGIASLAILREICEYDHTLIRSLSFSFDGPAYPGEALVAELWQDANIVSCRLRAPERGAVILDQGRCVLVA